MSTSSAFISRALLATHQQHLSPLYFLTLLPLFLSTVVPDVPPRFTSSGVDRHSQVSPSSQPLVLRPAVVASRPAPSDTRPCCAAEGDAIGPPQDYGLPFPGQTLGDGFGVDSYLHPLV